MKNKKALILLGVLLSIVIISLIVYAFNLSKDSDVQPFTTESTFQLQSTSQKDLEKEDKEKLELEKIKQGMSNIKNESLEIKSLSGDVQECDNEEAKSYEEKIKAGIAQTSQGVVLEKTSSELKIKFSQNSFAWTSIVKINSDTTISKVGENLKTQSSSFSEIQIGDTLVVKSNEKVTDESFVAVSVTEL